MASIEDISIEVTASVAEAVASLKDLQEELEDVADKIRQVDARGAEGISVRGNVHGLTRELQQARAQIRAFEQTTELDIDSDVDTSSLSRGAMQGSFFQAVFESIPEGGGLNFPVSMPDRGGGANGPDSPFGKFRQRLRGVTRQLRTARERISNFNIRMSDIHNLFATLVPLLVIMVGAVPAVATAIYGLAAAAVTAAGALAALGGLGALGVAMEGGEFQMENLTEVFEDIRREFLDAFTPLAERLQPLFEDAVDALGPFFEQIANQGDALMELTDEARDFGNFVMDFLPSALRSLAAFVEALAPLLADIGQAIGDNFNAFLRQLTRLTVQATPVVAELIQTIVAALPTIVEIGIQFAFWTNMILEAIGVIWEIITLFGLLDGTMGHIIAASLVLATAVSLLNRTLVHFAVVGLYRAGQALFAYISRVALATSMTTAFGSTAIASAIRSLVFFIRNLLMSSKALGTFALSARAATGAAVGLVSVLGLLSGGVLAGGILSMAGSFLGLSNSIGDATDSLKEFDRVSSRTSGFNPYKNAPDGSGAANMTQNNTSITIESSGDRSSDKSDARYATFRAGRTTGSNN